MKEKSTTHKAEELGSAKGAAVSDTTSLNETNQLSGEEKFLTSVMDFARGLKRSQDPEIAQAARLWVPSFQFRIQMTMQQRKRRGASARPGMRALRLQVTATKGTPTSGQSGVRIRVGVSPNQD